VNSHGDPLTRLPFSRNRRSVLSYLSWRHRLPVNVSHNIISFSGEDAYQLADNALLQTLSQNRSFMLRRDIRLALDDVGADEAFKALRWMTASEKRDLDSQSLIADES
jgi:hypothetical protein